MPRASATTMRRITTTTSIRAIEPPAAGLPDGVRRGWTTAAGRRYGAAILLPR